MMYQTYAMELASYGFMVFVLDHHDGSCCYTENATGYQTWTFDNKAPHMESADLSNKVNIRRDEVITLIDCISKPDFLQNGLLFSSEAKLDLDKLVMSGHSFGGSTSINVANSDPRIKCMFTQDAWLRPLTN